MKIGLTEDDMTAKSRQYTNSNREQWKALGFRMLTTQVHDEERELVLAELEVRKFQRMAMMAEDTETDPGTLFKLGTRNMSKIPAKADREAALKAAANSRAKSEVVHFLEQCRHFLRKHTGVKNNYDSEAPYNQRVRMEAKGVAYANLTAAYFKLAKVRLAHAERTSIFGLRGDDVPPVGD